MTKSSKKVLLTALVIFLLLSVIISNYHIEVITYNYADDAESDCRIVLISDLHGREFGKDNSVLLKKIVEVEPDIICLAGDFIDEDNTPADNNEFLLLLSNLTELAPVYYSFGNHDLNYLENNFSDLVERMENTGCIILDENFQQVYTGSSLNKGVVTLWH